MAINFKLSKATAESAINLIPFIDIWLVILIFLILTTTDNKYRQIQLQLPAASADTFASHQAILPSLEVAQKTGFQKITFTTQLNKNKPNGE